MMNQEAMGRRMSAAPAAPEGAPEGGEGKEGGGGMEVVKNVDQMIAALAQSMVSIPGGKELSQAMMQVKERFRAIVQAAMAASQGGGQGGAPGQGSQGQSMPQAGAQPAARPDQSQGRPYSPAGV